jgi:predicted AAA+ superfamily ATPase
MFKRPLFFKTVKRFEEPRKFIQVLYGPRQAGKTTLATQLAKTVDMKVHYAVSDESDLKDRTWIEQQWETARRFINDKNGRALLVIDEIQKIQGWSETIKRLWDEDTRAKIKLYVMILGSSPLLINKGLGDSLAGRYETINITHWSYLEMSDAFGFDLDQYIYFGGYPGGAGLINDEDRWSGYINGSLIESAISRDILQMTRIDKPALLKRLFHLGCVYSGQVLSYQKILGQLQDAGNTTTLAHYLDLLSGAGLLCGLQKHAGQKVRQRGSSPKFQVLNNGLLSAQTGRNFKAAIQDRDMWGRLTESCIGAHLANAVRGTNIEVLYWQTGNREVDYVLSGGGKIAAIEVKSGRKKQKLPGIEEFSKYAPGCKKYLVGTGGIPVDEFLKIKPEELL